MMPPFLNEAQERMSSRDEVVKVTYHFYVDCRSRPAVFLEVVTDLHICTNIVIASS